jgi:hypothetical protein
LLTHCRLQRSLASVPEWVLQCGYQ